VKTVFEYDQVDLANLEGKTIAIIGYGNQGRAHALNLRDSGVDVVVGTRNETKAIADGFMPVTTAEAVAEADVVMILLPDEVQGKIWKEQIEPSLKQDAIIGFAHGFAIAFNEIDTGNRETILVAPKGQGDMLRQAYKSGGGLPGLLAANSDVGLELAASYAKAVGCLHGGGFVTTFRDECIADQFGEQVVLCGGLVELIKASFETLVERGYDEKNAYFECVHEVKLIADLLHKEGVDGMRKKISPTAAYGGLTRGVRIITDDTKNEMHKILDEIESGQFAKEFLNNNNLQQMARDESESSLSVTGRKMRTRLDACKLTDTEDK
jgi:ketol-acid reductoisomerase